MSQQGRASQIDAVRQQVERLAEAVAHDELELKSLRQEIQTLRGQVAQLQDEWQELKGVGCDFAAASGRGSGPAAQCRSGDIARTARFATRRNHNSRASRSRECVEVSGEAHGPAPDERLCELLRRECRPITDGRNDGAGNDGLSSSNTVLGLDATAPIFLEAHRQRTCEWTSREVSAKAVIPRVSVLRGCALPTPSWPGTGSELFLSWTVLPKPQCATSPRRLHSRRSHGPGTCGTGCRKSARSIACDWAMLEYPNGGGARRHT